MRYTRLRSFHLGVEGSPFRDWAYRIMGSYTRHWGTYSSPLVNPEGVAFTMLELTHIPNKLQGWQFTGTLAVDRGNLIGNNVGGMLTIKKTGLLTR